MGLVSSATYAKRLELRRLSKLGGPRGRVARFALSQLEGREVKPL